MLSEPEITNFIEKYDAMFEGKLTSYYNYSRVVSLANFSHLMGCLNIKKQDFVGIISGSDREPELKFIDCANIEIVNFDDDPFYDLDKDWRMRDTHNFSIVLCNQVLEHVFNPHVAFRNLCHETRAGGYIYVTIPTINCIHGEPHFYSSGFHPRFLKRIGEENGLEILDIGWWGSYRYMIDAVSGSWSTQKQLQEKRNFTPIDFLRADIATDGTLMDTDGPPVITDCWALYKMPKDKRPENYWRRSIRKVFYNLSLS